MMDATWRKILRDLWLFKARTLLVVLAIAVGVGAFGLMTTARLVLERELVAAYAATNPAHATLTLSPFDKALLADVATLDIIQAAEGRRQTDAKLVLDDGRSLRLQLQSIPDFDQVTISQLKPEPGALFPPPDGAILLERTAQGMLGLRPGDIAQVHLLDGRTADLTVAGYVNDMAQIPSTIVATAYGYVTTGTAMQLGVPPDLNRLYVTIKGGAPDRPQVEQAITRLNEWLEGAGYVVFQSHIPVPRTYIFQDNLKTVSLLLGTLGGLTLVLSAFLVTNVMAAIMAQQLPQIGVLKALGGRTTQLTGIYLRSVFIFGLLALFIAVPPGAVGAYFLSHYIASQVNFDVAHFNLPWQTLLLQLAGAIGVPVAAALFPVLAGARLTIREAIGGYSLAGLASGSLLARLEGIPRLLALSLRNIFRQKVRLALTLSALTLAGAMFIAVFGVRSAIFKAIDELAAEAAYDVEVDFARPQPVERIEEIARQVEGVVAVESWAMVDARRIFVDGRIGGSFLLLGIPAGTVMAQPYVTAGHWLQADDRNAVFVNTEAVTASQMAVGETIVLKINNEQQMSLRVAGVSPNRTVAKGYVAYDELEEVTGQQGYASRLVVRTARSDPATQSAVESALLAQFEEATMDVARSNTTSQSRLASMTQMESLFMLLLVMAALIILVGGLGLGSAMGLNVLERSREIGVLRALGARRPVLRRLVMVEGVAIALLSVVFALALSVPLTRVLARLLGQQLLLRPLDYIFAWPAALAWLGLVVIIALVASWAPAENAARLTIREALAYDG